MHSMDKWHHVLPALSGQWQYHPGAQCHCQLPRAGTLAGSCDPGASGVPPYMALGVSGLRTVSACCQSARQLQRLLCYGLAKPGPTSDAVPRFFLFCRLAQYGVVPGMSMLTDRRLHWACCSSTAGSRSVTSRVGGALTASTRYHHLPVRLCTYRVFPCTTRILATAMARRGLSR